MISQQPCSYPHLPAREFWLGSAIANDVGVIMKLGLKRRSSRWTASFFTRGAIITGLMVVAINVSYLAAQALKPADPNDLVRNAVGTNLGAFTWIRDSGLLPAFAIAMAAFIIISLGHYFTFGPKDYTPKDANDMIPWFTLFERIVHALVLVSFVILAFTGLNITFGRYLGGGGRTLALREIHEMAGFVHIPAVALMMLMWIRDSLPASYDFEWFKRAGGYLGYKGQLKSGRFNAGQKVWFWVIMVTAVIHVWTGLVMFYQSGAAPGAAGAWSSNNSFIPNMYAQADALNYMRLYTMLHLLATIPVVLFFLVHLYMTSLGAKGALGAIINGKFSRTAALKFHSEARQLKKGNPAPASDD